MASASTASAAPQMQPFRRELQVVFQDPYSSLNPRMKALDIVAEPLRNFEKLANAEIEARVAELFDKVGLAARPAQRAFRTSSRAASASASSSHARSP